MSFKHNAYKAGPGQYVLEKGVKVPIHAFLSEELFNASEEDAWKQAADAANMPGVTKVVLTPDLHSGYGVPIGCVIVTDNTILPTAAGYDIGCGMVQLKTTLNADDVADKALRRAWIDKTVGLIGLGKGEIGKIKPGCSFDDVVKYGAQALGRLPGFTQREFIPVVENYKLPQRAERGMNQLGSLGGGNHFCEMQVEEKTGKVWVMVHTGSRGYGHGIADHFFTEGAALLGLSPAQKDLTWFDKDSELGKQYWSLHNQAANFAIGNRIMIGQAVCNALMDVFGGEAEIFDEISHNLIQEEDGKLVHRKGATRAFPKGHASLKGTKWEETGHPILIPGSMATGSAILYAEPNAVNAAYSVNHGSGRVMSRGQAKKKLNEALINQQMSQAGI